MKLDTSRAGGREGATGRPRDSRIEPSVLAATVDLLIERGYRDLTIGEIATRAGTSKPAIYRRWRVKANIVHEAVFPMSEVAMPSPTGDLRVDVRAAVAGTVRVLSTPAARAAVPGLLSDMAADPNLHEELMARFDDRIWLWVEGRLADAAANHLVRPEVEPRLLIETLVGMVLIGSAIGRSHDAHDHWIDQMTDQLLWGMGFRL